MAKYSSTEIVALAKQRGLEIPHLPGLSVIINPEEPSTVQQANESIVFRSAIAVSPMQAGYDPAVENEWGHWLVRAITNELVKKIS
ncbi:hypothetical protein [Novosphingopyxis sp.]|uniref:hypothetical protein n=1 Tax=Novosphingopyxis sp. TaxID=2709690 RepID=UPI003B5926DD